MAYIFKNNKELNNYVCEIENKFYKIIKKN